MSNRPSSMPSSATHSSKLGSSKVLKTTRRSEPEHQAKEDQKQPIESLSRIGSLSQMGGSMMGNASIAATQSVRGTESLINTSNQYHT